MERKQKENWEDNGCQNLFRLMNMNEPNDEEKLLNNAITKLIKND